MKPFIPTVLILYWILLLGATGCASIQKYLPWGSSDADSEYGDDPVAAAGMRLRKPASNTGDDGSDDHSWSRRYSPPVADTISYGMDMNDVTSVWGEPGSIESAGDSSDGNQRWTYYSGLSSRYGLGDKRIVYFENGRVVGWKK